ncbi:MAG: helicase-exonuclease AddAB subunit AddA, partial [Lachnospiraceae bacterium]|nr:helicase-exonuclease AddAB subunit AddA [Lachnospiraceae bacterium]
ESYPAPDAWIRARKEDYTEDGECDAQDAVGAYLLTFLARTTKGLLQAIEEAQAICATPDGPYFYESLLEKEKRQILLLAETLSGSYHQQLARYREQLEAIVFARLPSKKDDSVSLLKREKVKKVRSGVKDTLAKLKESFFSTSILLQEEQAKACRAPIAMLIDLVLEFRNRFREKKLEKHIIDFSDMEHYALDILCDKEDFDKPSQVAMEYRDYFHEILIDEYQDSNLVQEYLLKAIGGEQIGKYNQFMVGDVKQSIYKFRLARPELFLEKQEIYGEEGDYRRIDLSVNFRSRAEVIDTVNNVFEGLMRRETGGIVYDEKAALYVGAQYPTLTRSESDQQSQDDVANLYQSELLLIEKPQDGDARERKRKEALGVARRIQELYQQFPVYDRDTQKTRQLCYKDIVILLRTTSGWDEEFAKVLEAEGIPAYVTAKTGYFSAMEVKELLQFLRVLDNPGQDIALYGVMRSVFGRFTEEETALIRVGRKKKSLYEALEEVAQSVTIPQAEESHDDALELSKDFLQKCCNFVEKITRYRMISVYTPIHELLAKIIQEHDYLPYICALPGGSKRVANVEMLLTKASDFEKTSYFGLFHFVRYMELLEKYDIDYGEAESLDENADAVRIMSIHKSKGLEFPVVFVCGLSKRFNTQDVNQPLLMDIDLGIGTDYVNAQRRYRNKTMRRAILSKKLKEDNLAEELRVLYVALTRPMEKLILTACVDYPCGMLEEMKENSSYLFRESESIKQWRISFYEFFNASSYLDFLIPAIEHNAWDTFRIKTIQDTDLQAEELVDRIQYSEKAQILQQAEAYCDPVLVTQLMDKFTYPYVDPTLQNLYAKVTVSELKRTTVKHIKIDSTEEEMGQELFAQEEAIPYIPAFHQPQGDTPATYTAVQRGNAYHKILEWTDFDQLYAGCFTTPPNNSREFVEHIKMEQLSENLRTFLQTESRLSEEYRKAISQYHLRRFYCQPIAYRMWMAQRKNTLYREQPFVYGINADRLLVPTGWEDQPTKTETILIQGIIDAYFIEDGEIVLMDYKTDHIESMSQLLNRYQIQLDYYEEALSRLTGLRVKEKNLYSFHLDQVHITQTLEK